MTTPHPRWQPTDFAQAEADINAGLVRESPYLELKGELSSNDAAGQIRKALQAMANNSGTFVVGVREDGTGLAKEVAPYPLEQLPERVLQIAATLDPPLVIEDPIELRRDPGDDDGILIVHVPASMWAPHQNAKGQYFARDARRSFPMPDADVERLMRMRRDRSATTRTALEAMAKAYADRFAEPGRRRAWMVIVVEPVPNRQPDLLRRFFDAQYSAWAGMHYGAAGKVLDRIHSSAFDRTALISEEQWDRLALRNGKWSRTATGIRQMFVAERFEEDNITPEMMFFELDRDGTLRLGTNDLQITKSVLAHKRLAAAAAWALEMFRLTTMDAGANLGASIGVHVDRIGGLSPDVPFTPFGSQPAGAHPFTGVHWPADTALNHVEIQGDLIATIDQLFGGLYNSLGLPSLES